MLHASYDVIFLVDKRPYDRPTALELRKAGRLHDLPLQNSEVYSRNRVHYCTVFFFAVMKPGYTLRAPRTALMPSTFASARANGYFSDIEQCVTRDSDFDESSDRFRRLRLTPSTRTCSPHLHRHTCQDNLSVQCLSWYVYRYVTVVYRRV